MTRWLFMDLALGLTAGVFFLLAVASFGLSVKWRAVPLFLLSLVLATVGTTALQAGVEYDKDGKTPPPRRTADRQAEAERDYDKARLYFVTHYPDLKVLQFDTDGLIVRYERQDPRRVCKASLIPDGKIFLLGDDEDC